MLVQDVHFLHFHWLVLVVHVQLEVQVDVVVNLVLVPGKVSGQVNYFNVLDDLFLKRVEIEGDILDPLEVVDVSFKVGPAFQDDAVLLYEQLVQVVDDIQRLLVHDLHDHLDPARLVVVLLVLALVDHYRVDHRVEPVVGYRQQRTGHQSIRTTPLDLQILCQRVRLQVQLEDHSFLLDLSLHQQHVLVQVHVLIYAVRVDVL